MSRKARQGVRKQRRRDRESGQFFQDRRHAHAKAEGKMGEAPGLGYVDELRDGLALNLPADKVRSIRPARRSCPGCGLNRNAFDTTQEFNDHRQLCEGAQDD